MDFHKCFVKFIIMRNDVYPYVCRPSVLLYHSQSTSRPSFLRLIITSRKLKVRFVLITVCNTAVTQACLVSILSIKHANWEVQHLKVDLALNLFIHARFDDVTWVE